MPPDEEEKFELPEPLRLTPESLAAADAWQKELALKANSPFASMSSADMERARAARMAEHLSGDLKRLDREILEASITGGGFADLAAGRNAIAARLAEAYATIGRYDLAASISTGAQRDEYIEILEAVNRDDSEWDCHCAPGKDFIKRDIVLPDGQQRVLRACSGCGQMNAVTAIPEHLAAQRGHRQAARQIAAGLKPDEAAALLRSKGHTTEQLRTDK